MFESKTQRIPTKQKKTTQIERQCSGSSPTNIMAAIMHIFNEVRQLMI